MDNKKSTSKRKKRTAFEEFPDFGKIPPQAVDFEEAVLGALMLESDAFGRISETLLSGEYFYEPKNQKIFEAIRFLAVNNKAIDILTVVEQLKKNEHLDEVGGEGEISRLTANIATTAHIESHAETVAEKYLARKLILVSSEIQKDAFDPTTNIEELLGDAEGKIFDITQTNHKKDVMPIGSITGLVMERIEEASKSDTKITGVPSNFYKLDDITSGWQPSDLIIIAARPAMGKTAFTLTMAKNVAEYGHSVAFFSLEMSNVQLVTRLLSNASGLSANKLKSGKLSKEEFSKLQDGVAILDKLPIYIDDTPSLSVMEFRTKARRLVAEHNVKLIIIDYLQLMNATGMTFSNREGEVSIISRSLKALAKELNIPIIALSQLNRNVESRGGGSGDNRLEAKKPQLSDLRESGAIEQDADIVCFIHRPEYYKITEDPNTGRSLKGIAQIIIAKHRNGATDDVDLYFAQNHAMFVNKLEEYDRLMAQSQNESTAKILSSRSGKRQKQDTEYQNYPVPEQSYSEPPF